MASENVTTEMFRSVYERILKGSDRWNNLKVEKTLQYKWKDESTYIHNPPFFKNTNEDLPKITSIKGAYALCSFGDSITTDHISPAGSISKKSPAARFLLSKGI